MLMKQNVNNGVTKDSPIHCNAFATTKDHDGAVITHGRGE